MHSNIIAFLLLEKPQRPKFVKCFKDTKLPVGEQLRLEATVKAYPPPEVKWMKDGLPVRASSNIHFEQHPDGRTAIIVESIKPENVGKYTLVIHNKHGEATGEAMVEIEKKPKKPEFTTKLLPQTVVEGFPVRFEVKGQGFPAPQITW